MKTDRKTRYYCGVIFLILSSFLASRFAQEQPISLDASLVFEQSYSEVDGDSASVAELACLLSDIADVPLKQSLAVTGSVNQLGEVQAVGAVNEKIEGFFDVCQINGLTGDQGGCYSPQHGRATDAETRIGSGRP